MHRLSLIAVLAGLSACVTTPPEQDPVVQRMSEMDGRLLRIERILSNQSLLEQAQKVDALGNDMRALRGQVEQLQHQLETNRTQQRELFADIDRRMQALEARGVASEGAAASAANDETTAYTQARELLKNSQYADAAAAFKQFIATYPQSAQLGDAYYWLGTARFMNKEYSAALTNFKTVTARFADSANAPNAWLMSGDCYVEQRNWKEARDAYNRVVELSPGTTVGKSAEQRLLKLKAEGR
jgi:tol-pal system protein YbgF